MLPKLAECAGIGGDVSRAAAPATCPQPFDYGQHAAKHNRTFVRLSISCD